MKSLSGCVSMTSQNGERRAAETGTCSPLITRSCTGCGPNRMGLRGKDRQRKIKEAE